MKVMFVNKIYGKKIIVCEVIYGACSLRGCLINASGRNEYV